MVRASIVAAALAASVTLGSAEEPKKLTMDECVQLYFGLVGLDSYDRVVKDGGAEKIVKAQYRLGDARITIALNQGALKSVAEAAQKTRQAIIFEAGDGAPIKPDDAKANAKATEMWDAAMKEPCPVTPGRIKLGDLKLGDGPEQNQIPPSVLNAIMPIVDR